MSLPKTHKKIDRVIREHGFYLRMTNGGHCGIYRLADDKLVDATSGTPRDHSVLKNYVRQKIKRATGVRVPL